MLVEERQGNDDSKCVGKRSFQGFVIAFPLHLIEQIECFFRRRNYLSGFDGFVMNL